MQVIDPDFDRRIDLPGVGPCPLPVDIDQRVTGSDGVMSLRVYRVPAGKVLGGEADQDELLIVTLGGQVSVAIDQDGAEVARLDLGERHGVFLPPGASYRLTTTTDADIACARVKPVEGAPRPVAGFASAAGRLDIAGHASGIDLTLVRLPSAGRLPLPAGAERLVHVAAGEVSIAGTAVAEWQSAALASDEAAELYATLRAMALVVTARR